MPFAFEEFALDDARYELRRAGNPVKLDTQVLELLAYLVRNPERLVGKQELLDHLWQGRAVGDNVITVCMAKLRKALGGDRQRFIASVYGRGYRFVCPVVETAARASRPASAAPQPEDSPLVGRDHALARLRAALDRACAGRGGTCALLGEAGIGKTRLGEAIERFAREHGVAVAIGRSHAFGGAPALEPFVQVVRAFQAELPAELGTDALADITRDDRTETGEVVARWSSGASRPAGETLAWMTRVLAQLTSLSPRMLILEDVQWADAASLELLARLLAELPRQRVLVVLTVRTTDLPTDKRRRRALDAVLGHSDCERIELSRLSVSDVSAYTTQLFGSTGPALAAAVYEKSEGNPFFMVELLRPFLHGPAPRAGELALPGPALDIVKQALARLHQPAREVLAAAAVIGRGFELSVLSVVTERDAETLLELLEDAMNDHAVVAARGSTSRFAFGHELIRAVLYDGLAPLVRAQLHDRVARALEEGLRNGHDVPSAQLAHHLLAALPVGDIDHAVTHAGHAAATAARVGAFADAAALLRRALDALSLRPQPDAHRRCSLLYGLAQCERACGEPTYAEHFAEAVALARAHGVGEVLAAAARQQSSAPGTLVPDGAAALLEAAIAAQPSDARALRATLLAHLSWTPPHCLDKAHVAALLAQAEALAHEAGHGPNPALLRAQQYFAGGPRDHDRALQLAGQLAQFAAARPFARERALASLEPQIARIVALLQHGDFTQAKHAVEAFGSAARDLHHAELLWHHDRMCAVLRMNEGDFEHARAQLTDLTRRAEALQLHARKALEAIDWGELLRQTTDVAPFAAQLAVQLRPSAADVPASRAHKLQALANLGLLDEARAALQTITVPELRALPESRDWLGTLCHLAVASAATRSQAHVACCYELLAPFPELCAASLSFHCFGAVAHFLGLLARSRGDARRARAHFEHAISLHERLGLLPKLARSRFELGLVLGQSQRTADRALARELWVAARDQARELGMAPLASASERMLAQL